MASGAVRLAILAGAVVVGAVLISKGFPTLGQTVTVPSHGPTSSVSPTPSTSQSSTQKPSLTPRQQGVKIAVYNATSVGGLAAVTADKLAKNGGYVVPVVGNFPTASQTTLIYYRDAQGKVDAQLLKQKFLKEGVVKHLPAGTQFIPKTVELAIVLGSDYASAHPIG